MTRKWLLIGVVLGGLALVLEPWPLPMRFEIQTDVAPDGKGMARFYWRPAGIIGLWSRDNPWVYVAVRDASGRVRTSSIWADTPCDGVRRLRGKVPWKVAECTKF
jgi:hypothetical protein